MGLDQNYLVPLSCGGALDAPSACSGVRRRRFTQKDYASDKVRKLIGKISNGFEFWLTFILHPGVEPTNNRAERALREHVVLRKIVGTLRNGKGTTIHETIMTVLATWEQCGLNKLHMLRSCLSS